ncbi:dynein axonemal assembly factor 5 [Carassius gibelio]|uniref:dynein axonemal assembly factor 5 n=1 Tax=Carassius gibelio TaxID=101364 RepID=UPI002277E1A6|nr:dynein axonemal assembly factor 5 [Carassius gibelio]
MAAASEERAAADVLKSLARHLNCLNEDNKSARRRALEAVKRETVEQRLSSGALQELFDGLLKALLKCLSDPAETCRDTAIQILTGFIRAVPRPEDALPYLMPALVQRLGGQETLEPAEELRLALMETLSLLLELCGRQLAPFLEDMIKILRRTITDPFPEVKKESCRCVISAAQSIPDQFHLQAESLLEPLLQTISHQHSQVRVCVTQAIGAVIQHSTGRNVEDVLSHLAQRLFDDSPRVRKTVTVVVGDWLLRLPDRYSYFHKLIPLLLSSLSDEIPEIRSLAEDLWRKVGSQWEKENEDDLKDKMDFRLPAPALYTSGGERPGLGCRELVVRNLSKLLPAVARDIGDWLVQTRVKTAQLLRVLLLHAEDHCTQHLQSLLTVLYHTCTDPETDVRAQCLESAKLLGAFVSAEVYLKLLLPHVEDFTSCSSASPWAPLTILGAILRGSSREALQPHLRKIGDTLAHPEVCQGSQQALYLDQLLVCVDAVLCVCQVDCAVISLQLLKVLVSVQSLASQQEQHNKAEECVRCLCEAQGLSGACELYRQHMADLLQWLSDSHHTWTSYSIQKTQLEIIAVQSGPVVGEFLPALLPVLRSCLEPSRDPEMRLHIFTMLSKLLLDACNTLDSQGGFAEYMEMVLQDLLLPNLVWRSGRSAAAVRTAALSCLLAVLHGAAFPAERVLSVEETLATQLISALEEDSKLARLLACRSLHSLLRLTAQQLSADSLNKIYPELLKRVDDSSEDVRVEALKSLSTWFSSVGKNYDTQSCRPHLEFLFQQLLLYMDDPDTKIQDSVLEVLKEASEVDGGLLQQQTEAVTEKQRSPEYCYKLLQHIHSSSQKYT